MILVMVKHSIFESPFKYKKDKLLDVKMGKNKVTFNVQNLKLKTKKPHNSIHFALLLWLDYKNSYILLYI